jgi:alcohol dehydrogenase class IV
LISRGIHDEFLARLTRRIKDIKVGYQLLPDTKMGPLASAKQLETVERYVALGKEEGARLVCGGKRPEGPQYQGGCYFEPTIFAAVDNGMRIAQEEIFGPVLVVIPFDGDADAIRIANDSPFGLAGAVWSRDIRRARKVADRVRTGTMWINDVAVLSDFAPFGGYKASGLGREFGEEGLKAYTQTKMVYTSNEGAANRATFRGVLSYPPNEAFTHHSPTKIVCGPKSLSNLGNELRLLGAKRAVIITDKGLRAAGIVDQVLRAAADRCAGVFDGVVPDPTYECVDAALKACRECGADSLISVGGGSSIDAAKLTLVALTNGGSAVENMGLMRLDRPQLPHIAIPTTHGTGSEVTLGAVITNARLHRKYFVADVHVMPNTAILDATLVAGLPKAITIGTGMDALTHAIESVMSANANPMSTGAALQAIRMIVVNLPRAVADGNDLEARQNMLVASTLAGMALSAGLGIAHSYAHTVGMLFGVHHGTGCGIGLPHAIRFNRDYAAGKLVQVAQALGEDTSGMSDGQAADAAANAVEALMKKVGQPTRLSEFGVAAADVMRQFEALVAGTMSDLNNGSNPRPVVDPAAVTEMLMATV